MTARTVDVDAWLRAWARSQINARLADLRCPAHDAAPLVENRYGFDVLTACCEMTLSAAQRVLALDALV